MLVWFLAGAAIAADLPAPPAADPRVATQLARIRQMIAKNGYRWTAAPNPLVAIPWEEFQNRLGYRTSPEPRPGRKVNLAPGSPESPWKEGELPGRWDWREHHGSTPPRDQGNCGSCWAFAGVGALEGCALVQGRDSFDLSEQQMLACNTHGYGCGGGEMEGCYELFVSPGAVGEEAMPYLPSGGVPCRQGEEDVKAGIERWFDVDESVESIKAAVYTYGPVAVGMAVTDDFKGYSGGCYENPHAVQVNHGVVILGWDDGLCEGSWLCKNSWNTTWGDGGFFWIRYGHARIGVGAAALVYRPIFRLQISHAAIPTTTNPRRAVDLRARVVCNRAVIQPDSVFLHYRVNDGEFVSLQMQPSGFPDSWRAEFPGQPRMAEVEYYLSAVDVLGHRSTSPAQAPDSCFAFDVASFHDPCETPSGWTVGDAADTATSGIWECLDPVGTAAQPEDDFDALGSKCWVTGQHVEGTEMGKDDVDGGSTTLLSQRFELYGATSARVKYARWFSNDRGAAPNEDVWLVQARNDDGEWVDIERTTRSSNRWVMAEADLAGLLGPKLGAVQLRFVASDGGSPSTVEAAVDGLTILADPDTVVVPWHEKGKAFSVTRVWPNPMRTETTIRLQVEETIHASVCILAVDGRRVTELFAGALAPKRHEFVWDGRDASGRECPAGVYFCRLDLGEARLRMPIVVVR